jgi:hypothetical protein
MSGGEWPEDVLEALRGFGQGDIVEGVRFPYYGAIVGGLPLTYPADTAEPVVEPSEREIGFVEYEFADPGKTPLAVITSQTCDVCEEGEPLQPWAQVSPLRRLPDEYAGKTLPDFLYAVSPPGLPDGVWVVDLRIEVPIEKTVLVGKTAHSAFADEDAVIAFGDALGLRRDRAALSQSLTSTVGHSLRQHRRNKSSFKKPLREEVYCVALNIDEGSRSAPVTVRLHVITHQEPSERVQRVFGVWWDEAHELCAQAGVNLQPNAYHDRRHTDLADYDHWIKLDLG